MREHHENAHQIANRFAEEMQRAERAGCSASWRAAGETFCREMALAMRDAGISLEIHFATNHRDLSIAVQAASERLMADESWNVTGLLSAEPGMVVVRPSLDCESELRAAVGLARMERIEE